jgi:spore germination protein KB
LERKLSEFQVFAMLALMLLAKTFYSYIKVLCGQAGPAAWQLALVSLVVAGGFLWILGLLLERFPGVGLAEILQRTFGPVLGRIAGLLLVAHGVYYCGINLREGAELLRSYQLGNTNVQMILLALLLTMLVLVRGGVTCVARVSAACLWVVLGGLGVILLMSIPQYELVNLLPVWGRGAQATLSGGLWGSSALDELLMLLVVADCMQHPAAARRAGWKALLVAGGLLALSTLCYCLAFPYNISQLHMSPVLEMVRRIYFNRFFERFEAIFLFIFILSLVLDVAAYACLTVRLYGRMFSIRRTTVMALPFFFLIFTVALAPRSFTTLLNVHLNILRHYSIVWQMGIPLVALVVAVLRGKKGGTSDEKQMG